MNISKNRFSFKNGNFLNLISNFYQSNLSWRILNYFICIRELKYCHIYLLIAMELLLFVLIDIKRFNFLKNISFLNFELFTNEYTLCSNKFRLNEFPIRMKIEWIKTWFESKLNNIQKYSIRKNSIQIRFIRIYRIEFASLVDCRFYRSSRFHL